MKTKFNINDEIFLDNEYIPTLEAAYSYYENHYKKLGYILDKNSEDVYIIFDKEINLNEGDRVLLHGFKIVIWKCVDIEDDIIEYSLKEE